MGDLILASNSGARIKMLRSAGLKFQTIPADIDERGVSADTPQDLSQKLANAKALNVASSTDVCDGDLIIGSDQVLVFEDQILHKSTTSEEAQQKLKMMSGKTHHLISAVSVISVGDYGPEIVFQTTDSAALTMHNLTQDDLDDYMNRAGDEILKCVGGYAIEGAGAWLFEKIEGDFFTIMGMPLLSLLPHLRGYSKGAVGEK